MAKTLRQYLGAVYTRIGKRTVRAFNKIRTKARFVFSPRRGDLFLQIERNFEHRRLDNARVHVARMLPALNKHFLGSEVSVLSVGCCNKIELDLLSAGGFKNVIGVDLVPNDSKDILLMDMHEMSFADSKFDLVFCSGTLHCSYAPKRLAAEFVRVVRSGGAIALSVPVGFPRSKVYRFDPASLTGVTSLFTPWLERQLWSEVVEGHAAGNPNANTVVRTLFTIVK